MAARQVDVFSGRPIQGQACEIMYNKENQFYKFVCLINCHNTGYGDEDESNQAKTSSLKIWICLI